MRVVANVVTARWRVPSERVTELLAMAAGDLGVPLAQVRAVLAAVESRAVRDDAQPDEPRRWTMRGADRSAPRVVRRSAWVTVQNAPGGLAAVPVAGPAEVPAEVPAEGAVAPGYGVGLSPREADIVALIAEGLSNQEIADRLYLSINSVKTCIRSAYRRIGVSNRSQALLWVFTRRAEEAAVRARSSSGLTPGEWREEPGPGHR